jgi:nickel transport protein
VLERRRRSCRGRRFRARLGLAAALALGAAPALPHGLDVFAYADGALIEGVARFAGGTAGGIRILVKDTAGTTLAELTPAADGSFTYEARRAAEHLVIAQAADGHRAEWRVTADELAAGFPDSQGGPGIGTAPPSAMPPAALDPRVEAAVGRAVARQIAPLRRELAAARRQARLQDVLGGLGYVVGLAGFGLWWRGRRPGRPD